MEKFLRDLPLFVEVAKQKSFTRASENLDVPLSTVSRRIIALESELGAPLFYRSARKVELTEIGESFFNRCSAIVADTEAAWDEITKNLNRPTGRVRISMPSDIYHNMLADDLSSFAVQWPDIQLTIQLSQRWVDLHSEPFDLDLRLGPLPDSSLRAKKLGTIHTGLFASPKLMELYSLPKKPEEIKNIPYIAIIQQGDICELRRGKQQMTLAVKPKHYVNSTLVSLTMALAGLGITWLPVPQAQRYLEKGSLIRLLPDWNCQDLSLSVVFANERIPQRVRIVVDNIAEFFKKKRWYSRGEGQLN